MEDYFLGKATERIFLPLLKMLIPDIVDYALPIFGVFHNCAFIKIRKEYPFQARRVMHAIWGAGQMAFTKFIVVVDEHVNVHDEQDVLLPVFEQLRPAPATPRSSTAPSTSSTTPRPTSAPAARSASTPRARLRASRARPSLQFQRDGRTRCEPLFPMRQLMLRSCRGLSRDLITTPGVRAAATPRDLGHHWIFISLSSAGPGTVERLTGLLNSDRGHNLRYALLLGPDVDPADIDQSLFHWCANTDPRRDLVRQSLDQHVLIFDATPKSPARSRNGLPCREWPPIIVMTDEIKRRINARNKNC